MEDDFSSLGDFIDKAILRCLEDFDQESKVSTDGAEPGVTPSQLSSSSSLHQAAPPGVRLGLHDRTDSTKHDAGPVSAENLNRTSLTGVDYTGVTAMMSFTGQPLDVSESRNLDSGGKSLANQTRLPLFTPGSSGLLRKDDMNSQPMAHGLGVSVLGSAENSDINNVSSGVSAASTVNGPSLENANSSNGWPLPFPVQQSYQKNSSLGEESSPSVSVYVKDTNSEHFDPEMCNTSETSETSRTCAAFPGPSGLTIVSDKAKDDGKDAANGHCVVSHQNLAPPDQIRAGNNYLAVSSCSGSLPIPASSAALKKDIDVPVKLHVTHGNNDSTTKSSHSEPTLSLPTEQKGYVLALLEQAGIILHIIEAIAAGNKASQNFKKRLQQRYNDTQTDSSEASQKESTFHVTDVSQWQIQKWKKRKFPKADDAKAKSPDSKASKHKRPKVAKASKRSDFSIKEQAGYLEYESEEEVDNRLSQTEIIKAVDVTSAAKHFDLKLKDFGPYCINYTRNGRHLLLGGSRGHVAAFDWQTKSLSCEFNAMETVNSVKWLHQETLFTTAQRSGVYVYDNQGIELHALQNLDSVLRMEFLPYHMLLVTANEKGFLGYTDVSMGTRVAGICTGLGRLDTMAQNPANAVIHLGHAAGTVSMWTPTCKKPVMKILCHKAPVRAITIDTTGKYMATTGVDKRVKVFDLRTQKELNKTHIPMGGSTLAFSQRGLLAIGLGNRVQVYNNACQETSAISPYLSHVCDGAVQQLQFCPFEDVLGVGHQRGFTSLIVPGSGDADLDAIEINPMATKKQRQNAEVKLLLDKLHPEMIGLTNWVSNVSHSSTPTEAGPTHTKKLGKKQKEEEQREKTRAAKKTVTGEKPRGPYDPLSRFKKQ